MKFEEFTAWLQSTKGMTLRGASDVTSRIRRALKLLDADCINADSFSKMALLPEYKTLSINIRSQLKRAITLYNEFNK